MLAESIVQEMRSIGLLPHQVEFISSVLNAQSPARFVLNSRPGAGKGVAISGLVKALNATSALQQRCLIIAPTGLAVQWSAILQQYAGVDALMMTAPAYRRIQAETSAETNPWTTHNNIIASVDLVKRPELLREIREAGWSLVVLDEAHQYAATQYAAKRSQRAVAAQGLWNFDKIPIVVANGYFGNELDSLTGHAHAQVVSWVLAELRDWENRPLLPKSVHEIRTFEPSEPEKEIETFLFRDVARHSPDFAAVLAAKRWSSSAYALEQMLRRRLAEDHPSFNPSGSSMDELDILADGTPEPNSRALPTDVCRKLLELLESAPGDSKWLACAQLLREIGVGTERPVVVFTDFVETAQYVADLAESEGFPAWTLTGSTPLPERLEAVNAVERERGVLVSTSAVEGTRYPATEHVIHYDQPWNPRVVVERMGRVERLGASFPVIHHHFLVASGTDELLARRISNRLQEIEQVLGELDVADSDDFPIKL
jgi:hypothetical protein